MLRIGKNPKDQEENEQNERHDASAYSTPRNLAPTTSAETRAAVDAAPVTTKAMTESETLAREIKEGTLSGFVGGGSSSPARRRLRRCCESTAISTGKISSSSGTLIVGANGKVDANIEVAIAIIHGTVNGDIIASQRLELGRAAKVNGNIQRLRW